MHTKIIHKLIKDNSPSDLHAQSQITPLPDSSKCLEGITLKKNYEQMNYGTNQPQVK